MERKEAEKTNRTAKSVTLRVDYAVIDKTPRAAFALIAMEEVKIGMTWETVEGGASVMMHSR